MLVYPSDRFRPGSLRERLATDRRAMPPANAIVADLDFEQVSSRRPQQRSTLAQLEAFTPSGESFQSALRYLHRPLLKKILQVWSTERTIREKSRKRVPQGFLASGCRGQPQPGSPPSQRRNMTQAFWPPNPRLLLTATSIGASTALFGTYSRSHSGSG